MELTTTFLSRVATESPGATIVADPAFRVVWVNRAFEDTTGYRLSDIIGKRPGEFLQGPDTDRSTVAKIREDLRAGLPVHAELLNYRQTGEPFWVELHIRALRDDDGRILGYHSTQQDITTRRDAERLVAEAHARAQEVLDSVDAVIANLDPDGRITMLNRPGAELVGVQPGTLIGASWFDWFDTPVPDGPSPRHCFLDIMRGHREELRVVESTVRSATGEPRLFRWQVTYRRAPDGTRAGALFCGTDITERRAMQVQANRQARLEAIGTLAGGVAHDLNNALTPLLMGLEAVAATTPDAVHMIGIIEASAQRASALVRQLLTFAKGAEGPKRSFDPMEVVREVESLVRRTFPKHLTVTVTADAEVPVIVGDATQLQQVLLNLCVNARDAMPAGGRLTITAEAREISGAGRLDGFVMGEPRAGRYFTLTVADTGVGMAADTLDRIFEPFFTTKGQDGGTGLGLSNVLGIVRGHDGLMQVVTAPALGSTFTVWIPAVPATIPDQATPDRIPFTGRGRRVLYVDDEAAIRVVASLLLERLGCVALSADSADAAVRALAASRAPVHAVVTDQHMPGGDGMALVQRLRQSMPALPIILTTGLADDTIRASLRDMPLTWVLDKPFTQAQLAEALRAAFSAGASG